ncbi:hypothetical protein LSAT2_008258 [Lamellibrachia satsuma]|nr:hypothetical protein LSAT2_008258 [Lamellibrachia satsuma]
MAERSGASSSTKRRRNRKPRSGKSTAAFCKVSAASDVGSPDNDDVQQFFEVELAWCIQQLELSLQKDVSARQSAEAIRVLKVLKNPKAALVKKRHAMRTTFGDYRKKMQEEEKTFASSAKNIILRCAAKEKQDKSSFLRKCVSHATPEDAERHPVTSSLTSSLTSKAAASEPAAQVDKAQQFIDNKAVCFKFNFGVSDSTGDMPTDSSDNGPGGSDSCSVDTHTLAHHHTVAHDCCAFKVLPSDNSFKFNFTAIQDDQT